MGEKSQLIEARKSSIPSAPPLSEIALVFAKMGATAFGGPAAHIAMMEEEVVRRRKWLTREEFLDLLGATHLIPGPNSTEMAIHIGYKMGAWKGLIVAGLTFIVPAFLLVWSLGWFYVKYGMLPAFQSIFLGVKPVILAVIGQALWSLAGAAVKDWILGALAVLALALSFVLENEILILVLIACVNLLLRWKPKPPASQSLIAGLLGSMIFYPTARLWAQASLPVQAVTESLFLYFVKVGSVLFGSGYVLIAFLQNDLVNNYQWISQQQLIDAVTVGQFTPGPVFTTATFIGYLVSGHEGAVMATIGIFAPAFFFVAISAPFISALRKSRWTATLLDGLNVASLGLMGAAVVMLAKESVQSMYGSVVFGLSLVLLMRFKINSAWLIVIAGLLGFFGLNF